MSKKVLETPPTATLPCGHCGYQNEAERVYCHECGSKLDRSILPKDEDKGEKTESPEQARKRIAKMTNPNSAKASQVAKTACSVLIYSAVLAAILSMIQKPDDVPEVSKELSQRFISSEMMDLTNSAVPSRVDFSESEVNSYLRQTLKNKDGALPGTEFKGAYVNLLPGAIRVGSEQNLFGLPIYAGAMFRLEVKDGKFTATPIGGNIGRLAIHPAAMRYNQYLFEKLWGALNRERKQMDHLQAIEVQKGTITLVSKGGGR
jgi:hypothetical protein